MNQIDLISRREDNNKSGLSRIDEKRPEKLSASKIVSDNQKWKECKIIGKNIGIRSYSGSCVFDNKFYIYGGYQILQGFMSDFYYIDLDDSHAFNWVQILPKQDNLPGPRAKHGLVNTKQKIYLVAGLHTNMAASNDLFCFDPSTKKWQKLNPVGQTLPRLQSFGCVVAQRGGDDVIIIICGYNQDQSLFSNCVYEYNIPKNKLSVLFEGKKNNEQCQKLGYPFPRSGCATCTDGHKVYMFGGKDQEHRFNDLWCFDLQSCSFKRLKESGIVPTVRNGHTMQFYDGKILMFGGIHDITWQLDDLHIYHIKKQEWTTLEQDSARKIDRKSPSPDHHGKKVQIKDNSPKKKNWYETANSLYGNKSGNSSLKRGTTFREDEYGGNNNLSPGKMIDEQRKKAFYQKKAEMLKQFEIKQSQKNRYIQMETSSQAIKNSLQVIGNPNPRYKVPEGKITDFGKQSISKFLQPLENNNNLIIGKKPCARDGHCSGIVKQQLIIFGGDRHQMSFNDIYKLNLTLTKAQIGN